MTIDIEGVAVDYYDSFSPVCDRYSAYLIDIWGVLHDGAKPYPGAVDCLARLKELGKSIIFVSNAAKRARAIEKELKRFGISRQHYDVVVSSGEVFWRTFSSGRDIRLNALGTHYLLLGPPRSRLPEGLAIKRVESPEQADFVLAIGVSGNPSSTATTDDILRQAAKADLPMVCANPDLQVVRDDVMGIGPGAFAVRYKELGGKVMYFGKPHKTIYEYCFNFLEDIPRHKIAAVGDALITDIAGANAAGIDSVLIGTGIHADALKDLPSQPGKIQERCRVERQTPTTLVGNFSW